MPRDKVGSYTLCFAQEFSHDTDSKSQIKACHNQSAFFSLLWLCRKTAVSLHPLASQTMKSWGTFTGH